MLNQDQETKVTTNYVKIDKYKDRRGLYQKTYLDNHPEARQKQRERSKAYHEKNKERIHARHAINRAKRKAKKAEELRNKVPENVLGALDSINITAEQKNAIMVHLRAITV